MRKRKVETTLIMYWMVTTSNLMTGSASINRDAAHFRMNKEPVQNN